MFFLARSRVLPGEPKVTCGEARRQGTEVIGNILVSVNPHYPEAFAISAATVAGFGVSPLCTFVSFVVKAFALL
jgi:hypothetical protein